MCVVRVALQHLRDLADVEWPMAGRHQMRHRSSVAVDLTACGEGRASDIAGECQKAQPSLWCAQINSALRIVGLEYLGRYAKMNTI
jgi:hypothetical protein